MDFILIFFVTKNVYIRIIITIVINLKSEHMKKINVIKIGTIVNISIDGKLHKKNCGTLKEADELFRLVLNTRENPTDENIKKIRIYLNEKTRVASIAGLEVDADSGEVFLAGFNTPIPDDLVETIKEYHENNYPLDAINNFWKLLMINPDTRVRENLFSFIHAHDFVLTDTGYMLVYKAVSYKQRDENDLLEFVTNQYLHVKKDWGCSPNKYMVFKNKEGMLSITKVETAMGWDAKEKGVEFLGKLGDLNAKLDVLSEQSNTVYTDKHTKTMTIKLGVPVRMSKSECDADPANECSFGLHVGATKYVEGFANEGDAILVCLVNPAHVIAVPNYDRSKMRVSEYFPIALATFDNKKIDIVEQPYFESDYKTYEEKEVAELIARVQADEIPFETAIAAEPETRPMSELMKILETRLLDLS